MIPFGKAKIVREGKDATIVAWGALVQKSITKTSRLMIAHEEHKTSGFAGEIAARVNEECFNLLDAPILRVAALDVHCAYNPALEDEILPQISHVEQNLNKLIAN